MPDRVRVADAMCLLRGRPRVSSLQLVEDSAELEGKQGPAGGAENVVSSTRLVQQMLAEPVA